MREKRRGRRDEREEKTREREREREREEKKREEKKREEKRTKKREREERDGEGKKNVKCEDVMKTYYLRFFSWKNPTPRCAREKSKKLPSFNSIWME